MVIDTDAAPVMSAVTYFETGVLAVARRGRLGVQEVEALVRRSRIAIVSFDQEQADLACAAFEKYGKGLHPARLNFADCAAYALAKCSGEPLLFKGDDFARTDVEPAAR